MTDREERRRAVLSGFAEGVCPETVFGPDRPAAAAELASWLDSIAPSTDDVLRAAYGYGYGSPSRTRAYRNGCAFLARAYHEYGYLRRPAPYITNLKELY